MLQKITYTILVTSACVNISIGKPAFFKNDNPLFSITSGSSALCFMQDSRSSAPLNIEKLYNFVLRRVLPFSKRFLNHLGLPTEVSSTYQISPVHNISPIELFFTEFNSLVQKSKTLLNIFDLRDVSAEAFYKSMYDYVYARGVDVSYRNPHYIASLVATPLKEGIKTYTLPVVVDIFANSVSKYLFAKGILNSSNASSLARKYAKAIEESAEHNRAKEFPETKLFPLEEGFAEFFKSIDQFSVDTIEDLCVFFANSVKRVANKY